MFSLLHLKESATGSEHAAGRGFCAGRIPARTVLKMRRIFSTAAADAIEREEPLRSNMTTLTHTFLLFCVSSSRGEEMRTIVKIAAVTKQQPVFAFVHFRSWLHFRSWSAPIPPTSRT